jgi:tetratricopeptide (TPR) repeat protein
MHLNLCVSIMAYNVFSLDRITEWWGGLRRTHGDQLHHPLTYQLEVIEPKILNVNVLQDATRKRLIRKYRRLSDADYSSVIHALKQPFAGVDVHNDFVRYTAGIDEVRHTDVRKAVPELETELVLLDPPPPPRTDAWKARLSAGRRRLEATVAAAKRVLPSPPTPAQHARRALDKGVSWSQAGRYGETLRLYDRYLDAHGAAAPVHSWQIRLHRAVVLAKVEDWPGCLAAFDGLVRLNPRQALEAVQRSENGGLFPPEWEAGALRTPSFRLLVEGLAHRALQDEGAAAARWDAALDLDPGFVLARIARAALPLDRPAASA